jgi:dihydrofolate synthase/folylpolyglutamate synthase
MKSSTMTTMTYNSALQEIWDRSAYDRGFISNPFAGDDTARLGLKRTSALLDRLGRPDLNYRILHIAGSKGKGSTSVFAASILSRSGQKTGLYTSPHLHSYRERFQVDGQPISEMDFADAWQRVRTATGALEVEEPRLGTVTAFEMVTAMALDHFALVGCDAAVIEVGLGGTLDATNVVQPASTAITPLDYEHTKVLGSTLAEIAANKAGIIKPGIPVATAAMPEEALAVVDAVAEQNAAPWLLAGRDWTSHGSWRSFDVRGPWGTFEQLCSSLIGEHQVDNACLAIAGVWQMLGTDLTEASARAGLAEVHWPGRFEVFSQAGGHPIVLDGAHTAAAAGILARAYAVEFPDQSPTVLLGLLRDKEPLPIARMLLPIAERFVVVTPPGPRGLPAGELAAAIAPLGIEVKTIPEIARALAETGDRPIVVTGSLTTVASARESLGLAHPDPVFPV